jgi:hypothetical protein
LTPPPNWIRVFADGRIAYYTSKIVGKGQWRVVVRGGKDAAGANKRSEEVFPEVEIGVSPKIDFDSHAKMGELKAPTNLAYALAQKDCQHHRTCQTEQQTQRPRDRNRLAHSGL